MCRMRINKPYTGISGIKAVWFLILENGESVGGLFIHFYINLKGGFGSSQNGKRNPLIFNLKEVFCLTKSDLIATVTDSVKTLKKKDVEKTVDAVFASIQEALSKGDKAQFIGFGTFEVKQRKARKGRNPQSGKVINIPATKVPVFKAGKALKLNVAKK